MTTKTANEIEAMTPNDFIAYLQKTHVETTRSKEQEMLRDAELKTFDEARDANREKYEESVNIARTEIIQKYLPIL